MTLSNKLSICILAIFSLTVYFNSISFDLTGSDDRLLLYNALNAVNGETNVLRYINSPYMFASGLFYRPVVNASFYFSVLAADESLPVQFIINILLHSLSVILLYLILNELKLSKMQSLILAAVFSVNPAFVNTVSWIPGRNDSMLAVFVFISFLYLLKYLRSPKNLFIIIHTAGLLFALFTKEAAIAAVPVFAVYSYLFGEKAFKANRYKFFILWIFCIAAWYVSRSFVITTSAPVDLFKNIPFYLQAIGKVLMPVNLSVLPVIENTSFVFGAAGVLIIAVLYYFTERKSHKLFFFGIAWFVVFLFPSVININPEFSRDIMIESRLYLPAAGLFIALSQTDLMKKINPSAKYQLGFFSLVILLFVYSSIVYSGNYRNAFVYWQNAMDNSPSLDLAFSGLGLTYLQNEKYAEAVVVYKKAIELNPLNTDLYRKTAFCLSRMDKSGDAEPYYREILKREPGDFDANLILGIIGFQKKNFDESEKYLLTSKRLRANDPQPEMYLMKLYHLKGDLLKASELAKILRSKGIQIPEAISKDLN